MPKVLFVVHGMGDCLPGWSAKLVDLLDRTLAQYPRFATEARPFRDRVAVEEITYDAAFDKMVEPWGRQRAALEQFARDHALALDDTLTALAVGQLPTDVRNFVWETLLDPVLYRGSSLVRDNVRRSVIGQFLTAWERHLTHNHGAGQVEVSVLCHSLGTIVMSDVLAHVGEGRRREYLPFSAANRSLKTLVTLANVSRLGPARLIDVDSRATCVRPDTAPAWKAGKANYLQRLINVRHELDPFCLWQRFAPRSDWGTRYVDVAGVRHVHQADTHGFLHYLVNPRVHVPFFRSLLGDGAITRPEERAAVDAFPDVKPEACAAAVEALRDSLTALGEISIREPRALDDFVVYGIAAYRAMRTARDACHPLAEGLNVA